MIRFEDWTGRLEAFTCKHSAAQFQYGSLDCCLFVCDAINAMTGEDLAEPFRGYSSRKEAMERVKAYCGRPSIRDLAQKAFREAGLPEILPLCAQRGDVVLVKRPRNYSLGIVSLNGKEILAIAKQGIAHWPLGHASKAWRV